MSDSFQWLLNSLERRIVGLLAESFQLPDHPCSRSENFDQKAHIFIKSNKNIFSSANDEKGGRIYSCMNSLAELNIIWLSSFMPNTECHWIHTHILVFWNSYFFSKTLRRWMFTWRKNLSKIVLCILKSWTTYWRNLCSAGCEFGSLVTSKSGLNKLSRISWKLETSLLHL